MVFQSEKNWVTSNIKLESHKFLISRWEELFSEDTFDTWQIKSANFYTLLHELMRVTQITAEMPETHINIKTLIEEAKDLAKDDFTIKEHFPFASHYLTKLESLYKTEIENTSDKVFINFNSQLTVLIRNLHTYEEKVVESIKEILRTPSAHYKIKLDMLLMSLAVLLKNKGYSIISLQESVKTLMDPTINEFVKRFEVMVEDFAGTKKEFECYLYTNLPKKIGDIEQPEIKLTSTRPNKANTPEEEKFFALDKQSVMAQVTVKATDIYSARRLAEEKIETLFGISQLYLVFKKGSIKQDLALVRSDSNAQLITSDLSRLNYVHPAKYSNISINELADLFGTIDKKDYDKLNSALQYHKQAMSSNSDELRLVNLWIALESLFLGNRGSIIKRICKYVPKIEACGYVYRILKAVPMSINQFWKESDTDEIRSLLSRSKEYKLEPSDFLKILLAEEESPLLNKFIKLIKSDPLLLFRMNRLWEDFFGTPSKLSNILETHRKRVEWQIQRIYRSRNSIIHKGFCPPGARLLIQHLHSYFIFCTHTLIYDLKRNREWSLNDAMDHRHELFDYFISRLNDYENKPLTPSQILNIEKSLYMDSGSPAWSEARTKKI
jgi:hypothetical protein